MTDNLLGSPIAQMHKQHDVSQLVWRIPQLLCSFACSGVYTRHKNSVIQSTEGKIVPHTRYKINGRVKKTEQERKPLLLLLLLLSLSQFLFCPFYLLEKHVFKGLVPSYSSQAILVGRRLWWQMNDFINNVIKWRCDRKVENRTLFSRSVSVWCDNSHKYS